MSQTKTRGIIYSSNISEKNKGYAVLLECLRQKQGLWYTPRMFQTKTCGMIYSSNVWDKNEGYGILLEYRRQKEGEWYIPRMSQTKTTGMMYSSNVSHENKVFRVVKCAGFCADSLFGRKCAHYKQEQCVSLFPRPESANKTQYI
jgi:hypothetical protein